ncbi:IS4 family transposase [Lentibacillus sp. N15]|uniref:IS4 family transposase n=1 Tax=Lentibacillus songyuanensis TaxID=3136161 RepID=UPI0031B9C221
MERTIQLMNNDKFKRKSKRNAKDFTRERKVGFVSLLTLLLRMVRKSSQLELDEFREQALSLPSSSDTYTKQSFSEARQKLRPVAFTLLNDEFIRGFYEDGDFKTFHNFRLLAIDGSVVEIPDTKETRNTYGYWGSNADPSVARAFASNLYDIENKVTISSVFGNFHDSERDLAKRNIEKLQSFEQPSVRDLILFDRGYPSIAFMIDLEKQGISYVIRSQGSFLKEVEQTTSEDEWIQVKVTKPRARELKKQGTPIPVGTVLQVRVLKVTLPTGETETLLTNVSSADIKYSDSQELYAKRWGIESGFNDLKHKFEVENFSGIKPLLIEQDFYATIFLSNIASLFEQEAEAEWYEKNHHKDRKYQTYHINKSILAGKLRTRLIEMVLTDDPHHREQIYETFLAEIQRHVVPVIPGRRYKREKKQANRYSNTNRRSL